jgi:hypothetical protein
MTGNALNNEALERAAQWMREADGLLIAAGAGMGVDSALLKEKAEIYCTYAAHTVLNRWGRPSEVGVAIAFRRWMDGYRRSANRTHLD